MSDRSRPLTIVVAGGGTGGHLYPGIAVARALVLRRPDARVSFAGTAQGLEARVVPREGFELDTLRSAGLKGKSWSARIRGGALLLPSAIDAWRIVSRRRPDLVIGVGGYSSGPVVLTAAMRGIPTLLLEQNAVPGLTNRVLARWVRAAAVTYEPTLAYFGGRGFVSGNPVRAEFFAPDSSEPSAIGSLALRASRGPRLLVLGGSLGAHAINVAVVAAAPALTKAHPGLELVHQTGAKDLTTVREGYQAAGVDAKAEPFLDQVADEMRAADLVICRAGATTLAELAALGRPAILVPFPGATDDHQRKNAQVLANAGAATLLDQEDLSSTRLASAVDNLLAAPERLGQMRAAILTFARPDAATRIVDRILELTECDGSR